MIQTIIDLSHNQLTGSIPQHLSQANSSVLTNVFLDLSSNLITGTIPSDLLVGQYSTASIFLSNNKIDGTLPSNLFSVSSLKVDLRLNGNNIAGPLSANIPDVTSIFGELALDLSSNPIGGTFPDEWWTPFRPVPSLSMSFGNCSLGGAFPRFSSSINWQGIALNFDNNDFGGVYPWDELVKNLTAGATPAFYLSAGGNQFTGAVTMPGFERFSSALSFSLHLPNNNLTSMSVAFPSIYLREFNLGNNPSMTGTVPALLFEDWNCGITLFNASRSALSGVMPIVSGTDYGMTLSNLQVMDLSDVTTIEFCPKQLKNWGTPSYLTVCNLSGTNAINCGRKYPLSCFSGASALSVSTLALVAALVAIAMLFL